MRRSADSQGQARQLSISAASSVSIDPDCRAVDYDKRNERPVMLCEVRGRDLSLAMVRAGWAVAWCSFLRKLRPNLLRSFQDAEADARAAKRGIWARPVQPWRDWGCGRTFIRK